MINDIAQDLANINTLEGWCTQEKAKAMAEVIATVKPRISVELGVFGARSLIAQGIALRHVGGGVVWGIDPWTKDANAEGEDLGPINRGWWTGLDIEKIREGAINAITRMNLWEYVRVIVARSEHCCELFTGIDVLHIDGNHSEQCSTRDVELWLPKVRQGGYVWFDDYDWHTTKKAVGIVADKCDQVIQVGNCKLFRVK